MHWFTLGDGEIMLHPSTARGNNSAATVHVAVNQLDDLFERVKNIGMQPFDNQNPDEMLDGPVTRPWGDREFELKDPDGRSWAFTEAAERPSPATET